MGGIDGTAFDGVIMGKSTVIEYGIGLITGDGSPFAVRSVVLKNTVSDGGAAVKAINTGTPGEPVGNGKAIENGISIL